MKNITEIIKQEGDSHDWTYIAKNGLEVDCFIRRNCSLVLCGYVIITSDNKLFRLEYDQISSLITVYVHGGLTYSNESENGWVIGFDCAHAGDLCPAFQYIDGSLDKYKINSFYIRNIESGVYRTMEYVISECEKLAEEVSKFSGVIKRLQKIESVIGKD